MRVDNNKMRNRVYKAALEGIIDFSLVKPTGCRE